MEILITEIRRRVINHNLQEFSCSFIDSSEAGLFAIVCFSIITLLRVLSKVIEMPK